MASYTLRALDAETIAAAKSRARDAGTSLDDVLRAALTAYAEGHDTPAQQLAAQGGRARAASMSARERSVSARRAVMTRWAKKGTG
jgi:plasmid stability protein